MLVEMYQPVILCFPRHECTSSTMRAKMKYTSIHPSSVRTSPPPPPENSGSVPQQDLDPGLEKKTCEICGKILASKKNLENHVRKVHGKVIIKNHFANI